MNRRNFLSLAALAIAGKAAERVFPFRVYSIPKEIVSTSSRWDQFLMPPPSPFEIPVDFARLALFPPFTAIAEEMTLYGSGVGLASR